MKPIKITYWTTTTIVAIMMCYSAYAYIARPEIAQAFHHLGFPDYFRIELAIAKVTGAILLLIPVWPRLKEWAYAGFAIVFISALVAHTASGDPMANRIGPVVFGVLLSVSYLTYHKMVQANSARSV
ncbi:DoxX-like family protein [Mucilaginibacter sp. PPCGB 2223]|uniref:DoxX family protein n=1 Tax=Mucilaginibacter sp. PPCGB 2223 TaxID=1886027 RepID=UPI0008255B7D|nr:DoxX family protein [Mucilaginibacter sp. PPCGB 2223]OCX51674.1 DoxX-like family protein [Mucilaginibacter sp. PPCGB 2223]